MSNRSLLEFNHDYAHEISDAPEAFIAALGRYLKCADRSTLTELERYGVRGVSFRHHSETYYIDEREDGFPARYFKQSERAGA